MTIEVPVEPVGETSDIPIEESSEPPISNPEPPPIPEPQAEMVPAPVEKSSSLALPPNYKPISVPDAPAISQALQLARALRPLARQIAAGIPRILDEEATVDSIAETGIWQPVLKPESELWLDVALVFDTSPSMCLWQRLGVDLHRLLSRYGEFRDLRVWFLRTTATGNLNLTSRNGAVHKPSELLTGDRRRLVVIVSDCVGPVWHNGKMRSLIAIWSANLPTIVLHVFPERLWSRTALARSTTVELQGKQPGLPSNNLQPVARSYWDQAQLRDRLGQAQVRLPVVSVERDAISSLAKVVAGDRRARVLGIVWDAAPVVLSASQQPSSLSAAALKERIDSFLLTASPTARQLAGLLVSAPVITLPIARLIKQSMLPRAEAVHLAEVFMSGLLQVSGSQVPTFENAERIVYQLVDDQVRDRLRAGSLVVDALNVLEAVSNYVAKGLGKSVSEFKALLRTPGQGKTTAETEFLNAFATVTAKILRGLGSEFETIADQLQTPELIPADRPFPPLEDLEFVTAQLVESEEPVPETQFPPLQTQEVEVVTVSFEINPEEAEPEGLQRFEFEVATIERQTGLLQNIRNLFPGSAQRSDWVIRKQRRQAYQWVEPLGDSLQLEMVAIPVGQFVMGSPEDEPERSPLESPQHEVSVASFFMSKYPITQAQWRFVAGLPLVGRELNLDPSGFKGDKQPVENVSWYDAVEFCVRLSRFVESRLSAYTGRGYRLPTEAEWEYACRAGTTTPFHFGETITTGLANYDGNSIYNNGPEGDYRQGTTFVEHFDIANAFGLCDMHGNVYEWCLDHWHESYEGAPIDGRAWLTEDENAGRVRRGGSWSDAPQYCRSAVRGSYSPEHRSYAIGFRVICVVP